MDKEPSSKSEYSQLLSKALSTDHRFQVEKEPFDHNYLYGRAIENHHTRRFTTWMVKSIKKKYEELKRPLEICDFCCGCGDTTAELLQKIEAEGVQVAKVVGYDISNEFLELSKKYASDKLTFQKRNLEKDFKEVEKFDVMIILHGLLWMNNLDKAIEAAAMALRPGGLFFALTLIENKKFYLTRLDFMQHSKWKSFFKPGQFQLYPFHFSEAIYLKSFQNFFDLVHEEKSQKQFQYKKDQLAQMLEGDFQEVRHLQKFQHSDLQKDEVANAYTTSFVASLSNIQDCIELKGQNLIGYKPVMFFYEGARKKQE